MRKMIQYILFLIIGILIFFAILQDQLNADYCKAHNGVYLGRECYPKPKILGA